MHSIQAAKKLAKKLAAIEQNQKRIIAMLEAMNAPVEMVELGELQIPEEIEEKPTKKLKAKA